MPAPFHALSLPESLTATLGAMSNTISAAAAQACLPPEQDVGANTVEQLGRFGDTSHDARLQQLFGQVPQNNYLDFFSPDFKPALMDPSDSKRDDDAAIEGLQRLIDEGKIDGNTIVVGYHGHAHAIWNRLLENPRLDASGMVRTRFLDAQGDFLRDQRVRAKGDVEHAQLYAKSIDCRRNPDPRGAVYLGLNIHGLPPPVHTLPSAEVIRAAMGPGVKMVFVAEKAVGKAYDPGAVDHPDNPVGQWAAQLRRDGIPIAGFGIDSRPHLVPDPGGTGMHRKF